MKESDSRLKWYKTSRPENRVFAPLVQNRPALVQTTPRPPGLSGKKRRPCAKKPQAFVNPSRLGAKMRPKTTAVLDGPAPDARNDAKVGL
jgi:hypothetical protein